MLCRGDGDTYEGENGGLLVDDLVTPTCSGTLAADTRRWSIGGQIGVGSLVGGDGVAVDELAAAGDGVCQSDALTG